MTTIVGSVCNGAAPPKFVKVKDIFVNLDELIILGRFLLKCPKNSTIHTISAAGAVDREFSIYVLGFSVQH